MSINKTRAILGLGSNINPDCYLPMAIDCLQEYLDVCAVSSIWQTKAVGSSGPDYLNAVLEIETDLPIPDLKECIISHIENELDRVRLEDKYADRTIDIDILIYGKETLDDDIWRLPHIAVPLSELEPDLINPKTGESLSEIAQKLINPGIKVRDDIYITGEGE